VEHWAKEKQGTIGAGGVTMTQGVKKVKEFSWDLGEATNNKAEALVVLQGLKIPKSLGVG